MTLLSGLMAWMLALAGPTLGGDPPPPCEPQLEGEPVEICASMTDKAPQWVAWDVETRISNGF